MRIAFAGASGTGKSALAEWVAKKYGLPLNPVGARSVAKSMGFENPYDVDRAGKRDVFQTRLQLEKTKWEADNESFVTDRTTLDEMAYTTMHEVYTVDHAYWTTAWKGWARYTIVFYCPLDVFQDVVGDPARVADLTYHKVHDAVLRGLLDGRSVIRLQDQDLEQRKIMIEKQIRHRGW